MISTAATDSTSDTSGVVVARHEDPPHARRPLPTHPFPHLDRPPRTICPWPLSAAFTLLPAAARRELVGPFMARINAAGAEH